MDDELSEDNKTRIVTALEVLNEFGPSAAEFLYSELLKEEHSEAEAWISAFYEPIRETQH
jgi:hypothetical protein